MQLTCPNCQNSFDPETEAYYIDPATQKKTAVCPRCTHEIPWQQPAGRSVPMVATPTAEQSFDADQGNIDWEENWRSDFFGSYFRTVKSTITDPVQFLGCLPASKNILAMCVFVYVTHLITLIPNLLYNFLLQVALGEMRAEDGIAFIFAGALTVVIGPFMAILSKFIMSGIMHVSFTTVGGSQAPFSKTMTVFFYSSGIEWFGFIPVIGQFVVLVYHFIIGIGAMARAHRISGGRAALSFLLPLLICCCCLCVIYAAFAGVIIAALGSLR